MADESLAETTDKLIEELDGLASTLRQHVTENRAASGGKAEKERLEGAIFDVFDALLTTLEAVQDDRQALTNAFGRSIERFKRLMQVLAVSAGSSQVVAQDERLHRVGATVVKIGDTLRDELRTLAMTSTVSEEEAKELELEAEAEEPTGQDEQPGEAACRPAGSLEETLSAKIFNTEDEMGEPHYHLRVNEGPEERYFVKTHADFKKLDEDLKANANPCIIIPRFPALTLWSVEYYLNLGDARKIHRKRLQEYLDRLLYQLPSTNSNLDVAAFLGRVALSKCVLYHDDAGIESI